MLIFRCLFSARFGRNLGRWGCALGSAVLLDAVPRCTGDADESPGEHGGALYRRAWRRKRPASYCCKRSAAVCLVFVPGCHPSSSFRPRIQISSQLWPVWRLISPPVDSLSPHLPSRFSRFLRARRWPQRPRRRPPSDYERCRAPRTARIRISTSAPLPTRCISSKQSASVSSRSSLNASRRLNAISSHQDRSSCGKRSLLPTRAIFSPPAATTMALRRVGPRRLTAALDSSAGLMVEDGMFLNNPIS